MKALHPKFDNLDIPPTKKLVHLQEAVQGQPSQIIGLDATNLNYMLALQMLNDQYDKPDQVISEHGTIKRY